MKYCPAPLLFLTTLFCALPALAAPSEESVKAIDKANDDINKWAAEEKASSQGGSRIKEAFKNLAVAKMERAVALGEQGRWKEAESDWESAELYSRRYNTATNSTYMSPAFYMFKRAEAEYKQQKFEECLTTLKLTAAEPRWRDVQQEATILLVRTNLQMEDYQMALSNVDVALDIISKARAYINTPTAYVANEITTIRLGSVAHYLRGDMDAAMTHWKKAAGIAAMEADNHFFAPNQLKFNQQVASNPTDPQVRLSRARYFLQRGESKANKTLITNDFLDSVITADGQKKGAQASINQGGLGNLIDLNTPTTESFYQAAIRDFEKGLQLLQQADAPMPERAPFHLGLGTARLGFNESAPRQQRYTPNLIIKDYEDAGRAAPKSAEVQIEIGDFYRDRAIEVKPDESTDWKERKSNLAKAAIGAYSKAIYFTPKGTDNAQIIGTANKLMPWVVEGKLENAPTTEPKTALEWKERGNLYNEANDWRKAIGAYEQSLKVDPNFADSYNNLGSVLMRIKRYDLALTMLNKGLQISPRHRLIYFNRSKLWGELAEPEKALEDSTKAIEYAETPLVRRDALAFRSSLYKTAKEPTKALADIVAATEIEVGDKDDMASAWILRGDLELRSHKMEAAEASLSKGIVLSPTQTRAHLLRGLMAHLRSPQNENLGPEAQSHLEAAKTQLKDGDRVWLRRYCNDLIATPAFKDALTRIEAFYQIASK